jgi:hypothetical protein
MNRLKIAVTMLGCILTLSAQAKEYIGFDLCSNINKQSIKDIADKHNTSNVTEGVRNWSNNDIYVLVDQYLIGNKLYYVNLQLYKGKLIEIGIRDPGVLLDYITAKYGNNYAKITEEYNSGVSSKNYFYGIKEDPSAQIVFSEHKLVNQIGEAGEPYYSLAYHCTILYKQYVADKVAYKNKSDKNNANDLGL